MGNIAISAIGATVKYCAEASAGTKPTTGYIALVDVRSAPAISKSRNMIECSPITSEEEEYAEGKVSFTNEGEFKLKHTAEAITAWEGFVTAYASAKAAGKGVWVEYKYASGKSFYFKAAPGSLGNDGLEDGGVEIPAPCGILTGGIWDTAST